MMASRLVSSRQQNAPYLRCQEPSFQAKWKSNMLKMVSQSNVSRRIGVIATVGSALLATELLLRTEIADGLEMETEETVEESMKGVKEYADSLSEVKAFLETESWKEAQKELRRSSSNLKLDLYNIIQSKPGTERPLLRQLYFNLFNNVTKLDYAARDKDTTRMWQYYGSIVEAYNQVLSKL